MYLTCCGATDPLGTYSSNLAVLHWFKNMKLSRQGYNLWRCASYLPATWLAVAQILAQLEVAMWQSKGGKGKIFLMCCNRQTDCSSFSPGSQQKAVRDTKESRASRVASQRWLPLAAERGDSCLEKVLHWDTNQLECQRPELRTLTPARWEAGQLSPFRGRRGGLDLWGSSLRIYQRSPPNRPGGLGSLSGHNWDGLALSDSGACLGGGGFSFSLAKQETKHWWMHDFNTLLTRGFLQKLMPVAGDLLCKWILIQSSQKRSG